MTENIAHNLCTFFMIVLVLSIMIVSIHMVVLITFCFVHEPIFKGLCVCMHLHMLKEKINIAFKTE